MKNLKRKILPILACAFFMVGIKTSHAVDWSNDKQSYMYGAGLSQEQVQSVAKTLDLDMDNVNMDAVRGSDPQKYLGYTTEDYNMISSVAVKKLAKGKGITVDIKTPANITSITEGQYTNAAITAGITDAEIKVAAPVQVTGESALVGVYKAVELAGGNVDTQRTQVAQEELGSLKKISEENASNENFDKDKLDKVVIDVKQKLQEHKEKNGTTADEDQIKIYIQDALNNVNMGDVLSNNNIQILVNFFDQYQHTSAIDSKEVKENLKKFAGEIGDKAGKFYQDNKEQIDKTLQEAKDSGLWDKIVDFFNSIFESFTSIFSSDDASN